VPPDTLTVLPNVTLAAVPAVLPAVLVAHLAYHRKQDRANTLDSGFVLGDGTLTVAQLMALRLPNAALAVMSACETAKGDSAQPDQAVHLAAAVLFVGLRSVVGTMWCAVCLWNADSRVLTMDWLGRSATRTDRWSPNSCGAASVPADVAASGRTAG
jgi:hypothetical protein